MLSETLKVTGKVSLKVFNPATGEVKEEKTIDNLVVTAGKTFIASRMVGTSAGVMSHMALGSSNTAAAAGNTGLGGELGRVALTSGAAADNVVTYTANFPAGTATGAVVEAGLFNASESGTMLCRTVFSVVNKGADDAMTITWQVTVS
jgi:hypothetical protein